MEGFADLQKRVSGIPVKMIFSFPNAGAQGIVMHMTGIALDWWSA
jgi:hypothetical protein